jgi:hypothetical protein
VSRIKPDKNIGTCRFRQAVYLKWCSKKRIPDPCGNHEGYHRIIACFIQNLLADTSCKAKTIGGYITSINELFTLRGFQPPVNILDRHDINVKIINAIEAKEDIANQRSPITNKMFTQMGANAASLPQDSIDQVMFDFFCLVRICGFGMAEYAQTTQTKVNYHEYPSGKRVIKAFLSTDWVFRDKNNRTIKPGQHIDPASVKRLIITFRIQKNRQNGQKITVVADSKHPKICPVWAALRIAERASRINLDRVSEPLAVYYQIR